MASPNFFIVGAPKCGTTSLSAYLREHPQVFMATPKELGYFATDLPKLRNVTSLAKYEQLFAAATDKQIRRGEASVLYMPSRQAASLVKEYAPRAKIVIMVRNPLDLLASWHAQLVCNRDETEVSFERAWDLRFERKLGRKVPQACRHARLLWYHELARLGKQTDRWVQSFGQEQVKIVCFDDLKADAGAVYRDVLEFLDLPDDGRESFPIFNARKRPRLPALATLTERPPQSLARAAMLAKKCLGIKNWGVLSLLRRWNTAAVAPGDNLAPRVQREILATYMDDMQLLGELADREFANWIEPAGIRLMAL
ncbi:MAG: sulfotransferase [Pirellulales bacterium]